jgi:6-phosphofructokinase 2
MPDILTVTLNPAVDVSTTAPRVVPTHKVRCAAERRDAGGGGLNVARVIKRLGGDVLAAYPAGGPIGDLLRRRVDAEHVPSLVIPIAGDTRESFTVCDRESGAEYRFVLPGPSLTMDEFARLNSVIGSIAPAPHFIVASGSIAPGLPADAYAQMAAAAKTRGVRFVLDASGDALKAALEAGVYLVKPNQREMQDLTGEALESDAGALAAARQLIASGQTEIVALSQGAQGALLVTADAAWKADAIDVPVASSVGAGDSFLAALVWALARGDALDEAFRYALGAGAAALLTPGTELCRAEDVRRYAAQVRPRAM